jgi:L-alanine-DL-glutamate epimerase-like enolase superfamily enzyme
VMREAVGEDVEIMLDVTQRWSVDQAIEYGRAVLPYRPYWLEDPLPHEDYEGLRRVREALDTPVCAGEAYRSVVPFRHMLTNRSVDIAMIDLDVGLSGFMRIAHLAEAFGLPVVTHLAPEILAHGIAATPNGLTVEYIPWATPLFREAPRLQGGQLLLSGLPGLGLELDEAGLQKYAL